MALLKKTQKGRKIILNGYPFIKLLALFHEKSFEIEWKVDMWLVLFVYVNYIRINYTWISRWAYIKNDKFSKGESKKELKNLIIVNQES